MKTKSFLGCRYPDIDVDEIHNTGYSAIKGTISNFFSRCEKNEKEELWKKWVYIREMIFHLNDRVNYWETRRTQLLQVGLALLVAFGGISFALFNKYYDPIANPFKGSVIEITIAFILLLFCFLVFVSSFFMVLIWHTQNNPKYPFVYGYKIWLWHWRHAEHEQSNTKISIKIFSDEVKKFSRNMLFYKEKLLNSSNEELLDQDISQLYLLITNEKYKIKMVTQLQVSFWNSFKYVLYFLLLIRCLALFS